ncbi:DUF5682 family protein [Streptomonospora nanhaiensis]|uniref:DUF5682 family protein n=1 Tax=Streptomonospora nanhaiensis TaxID=1323731 RepID=UPI001C99D25B|nr:DUF5682 family protein [Streptomonospora nanhaiensis]MBX9388454.1 hypothetical protein [Streptomonospora nanhaiensis]
MARVDTDRVHVLGVRHHGPGSARAVAAELERLRPDLVLIEGPPEADQLTGLVGEGLEPPVALLAYVPGEPARAAFWPFAVFSPEWVALSYAARNGVEVRFCDLPAAHTLAEPEAEPKPEAGEDSGGAASDCGGGAGPGAAEVPAPEGADTPLPAAAPDSGDEAERRVTDPLGVLAEAAGYDDPERWWDEVVEGRETGPDTPSPFPAIAEAMAAVRAELGTGLTGAAAEREARREAHMRQVLRKALREDHRRIAVVCGAWHVPALLEHPRVSDDTAVLRGLPKAKVAATWIPWTHGRLAAASGYRAGVRAPGWYHHLFTAPDRPVERWLAEAGRLLRERDHAVSSAHVIEAVRLTQTLAVLRGRPLAGLEEVADAVESVLCEGARTRAEVLHRDMVVGERLGSVPEHTPMVPLQRDLAAQQKRVRLQPSATPRDLDLDLREDNGRRRSVLLHRLRLLGVNWGTPQRGATGSKGTFRESWHLVWAPELDLSLIEAGVWGTDVESAATARVRARAAEADLPTLTALAEKCLHADLTDAIGGVLAALTARAAEDTDIERLMAALPPLARSVRYGDVRKSDSAALHRVAAQLLARVCAGLVPALTGLDDAAAAAMVKAVDAVQGAAVLLGGQAEADWLDALGAVAVRESAPGRVAGRANRILHDAGRLDDSALALRMTRATSRGVEPARAAAWLEGFLSGSGLLLVHDTALLEVVDTWLAGLSGEAFTEVLPLVRRTFGSFAAPERRAIGDQVSRLGEAAGSVEDDPADDLDPARAAPAVAAVAELLGVTAPVPA